MPTPVEPEDLRPLLDALLLAWRRTLGRPVRGAMRYNLEISGPELELEVPGWGDARPLRGRLSAFGLLAGRFWAAAELEGEAFRLCPARLPTLLEAHAQPDLSGALRAAARLFQAAGEDDEAALCLARSVPAGVRPRLDDLPEALCARFACEENRSSEPRLETLLPALKDSDPLRRLAAVRRCAAVLETQPPPNALKAFRPFRDPLRVLLADVQPALHERALALTEIWARHLWNRRAYREALPLLDVLAEASVAIDETLGMRHESRLAVGDLAGARNDWARLTALRARVPELETSAPPGGAPGTWADLDGWQVSALARVATAHLSWAAGADPCPDRPGTAARPPRTTRLRHLVAARARVDEALSILERPGRTGGPLAASLRRLRAATFEPKGSPRRRGGR